ncbi:MAG TPA: ester cyclase [Gaiellaceae bacterium]
MGDARQIGAKFVDAFNAHDETRLRELNGEHAVFEAPGEVRIEGRDAVTEYAMAWLRAFPDARLNVNNELADGDWVVQEFTFEGTHEDTLSSPSGDIPATHNRLNGRGVQIFKVEGEVVTDTRLYFDQVQVMTQLGLMPEPAAATS